MSTVRKIYTSPIPMLDAQIVELVNAVSGIGGHSIVVRDPETGARYELIATRMRDEEGNIIVDAPPQLAMVELEGG